MSNSHKVYLNSQADTFRDDANFLQLITGVDIFNHRVLSKVIHLELDDRQYEAFCRYLTTKQATDAHRGLIHYQVAGARRPNSVLYGVKALVIDDQMDPEEFRSKFVVHCRQCEDHDVAIRVMLGDAWEMSFGLFCLRCHSRAEKVRDLTPTLDVDN
jgi:hypothetical protein